MKAAFAEALGVSGDDVTVDVKAGTAKVVCDDIDKDKLASALKDKGFTLAD